MIMKSINDYISLSNEKISSIDDYIDEITNKTIDNYDSLDLSLLEHINIHYKFNYRLVNENNIYESDGSFPNQHNIIKQILTNINVPKSNKTYIINLNTFIKDLYIHFKTNNDNDINGMYIIDNPKYSDYNDIRWDNENNVFRFVEIIIYNYDKDPNGLEEILYHETKHIWDEYIEITKHNNLLVDKVNKSILIKLNKTNIDETLKQIIYYCEDYEISSYISQLNGIFNDKKFLTIEDAFEEIRNSSIYQNYKFCYYILMFNRYKDILLQYISNKEYKKLQYNIKRAWKKIINHSYIICCNHLSNIKLNPSNKKPINIK